MGAWLFETLCQHGTSHLLVAEPADEVNFPHTQPETL
jgi:hypothetical protein